MQGCSRPQGRKECMKEDCREARSSSCAHIADRDGVDGRVRCGNFGCPQESGAWAVGPRLGRTVQCAKERRPAEQHEPGRRTRANLMSSYSRGALSVLLLALASRSPGVSAKIYKQPALLTYDNWVFLEKFVFDTTGKGKVTWQLQV